VVVQRDAAAVATTPLAPGVVTFEAPPGVRLDVLAIGPDGQPVQKQ
jgi:hypothetical protein